MGMLDGLQLGNSGAWNWSSIKDYVHMDFTVQSSSYLVVLSSTVVRTVLSPTHSTYSTGPTYITHSTGSRCLKRQEEELLMYLYIEGGNVTYPCTPFAEHQKENCAHGLGPDETCGYSH
jgi:hypothetical protein